MAYCRNCGAQIHDEAVICPQCGVQQAKPAANDSGSIGWALLGCCVPIVGLILFLIWKDTQPRNAKKAGLGALVSVILCVLFYVILFVFMGAVVSSDVLESMMYY